MAKECDGYTKKDIDVYQFTFGSVRQAFFSLKRSLIQLSNLFREPHSLCLLELLPGFSAFS